MTEAVAHSIEVRLEAEDYVAAQRLHLRSTRGRLAIWLAAAIGGVALLIIPHAPMLSIAGIMLVSGAVAYEYVRRVYLPQRSRHLFAQQKSLHEPITVAWDAAGVEWTVAGGSIKTPWTHYLKRRENERLFLLYQSDLLFQMLPKRAFTSDAQLHSFATELERVPKA